MESDRSFEMTNQRVDSVKSAVRLQEGNQKTEESGHMSAPNPGGPSQSDAVPSGSPGK